MDKQSDILSNYVAKVVINNSDINITPDAEMESEHSSVCKQTVSDLVDTSETRNKERLYVNYIRQSNHLDVHTKNIKP
jgi:hypothetical protein